MQIRQVYLARYCTNSSLVDFFDANRMPADNYTCMIIVTDRISLWRQTVTKLLRYNACLVCRQPFLGVH